jgi:outer membrane protein assembly factor BamB
MRRVTVLVLIVVGIVSVSLPASAQASTGVSGLPTVTLSSTLTSSADEAPVTFSARVSNAAGSAKGSVTFTDLSNGTVLGVATVTDGIATFSTAALAPGIRNIVAQYNGTGGVARSAPVHVTVASGGGQDTTYQIDARHDGDQVKGSLNPATLSKKWTDTLGELTGYIDEAGYVSYPVIAGGRVFVTVENSESYGTELYALDAASGNTDWSVALPGTYGFSALTFDGQSLFALNYDGVLTAFQASTGHELWSAQMPNQYSFTAPPTAYDGVVYVSGAGFGGTVYAVRESDGTVNWTQSVANGDKSSPAVDDSGVYESYACNQDYRFSLAGTLVWHYATGCDGGGGSTAVLHRRSLYARGAGGDTPVILSTSHGSVTGTFASRTTPAFAGKDMFTLVSGNLVAVNLSGSRDHWTFENGNLVTAPVVSGGVVYVGAGNGTVYGISESSGTQVWSGTAGSAIAGPDEQNADILAGAGIGGGLLVMAAENELTAFGS